MVNHKEATVSGPTLPMYIIKIKTILLAPANLGVIPVDKPTVPKAEVTSNIFCTKVFCGSKIQSAKVPVMTIPNERGNHKGFHNGLAWNTSFKSLAMLIGCRTF